MPVYEFEQVSCVTAAPRSGTTPSSQNRPLSRPFVATPSPSPWQADLCSATTCLCKNVFSETRQYTTFFVFIVVKDT